MAIVSPEVKERARNPAASVMAICFLCCGKLHLVDWFVEKSQFALRELPTVLREFASCFIDRLMSRGLAVGATKERLRLTDGRGNI